MADTVASNEALRALWDAERNDGYAELLRPGAGLDPNRGTDVPIEGGEVRDEDERIDSEAGISERTQYVRPRMQVILGG